MFEKEFKKAIVTESIFTKENFKFVFLGVFRYVVFKVTLDLCF